MAGIVPVGGSASGKFRRRRFTPIAEINVTPLVDVMLVLLIIFMITAPLLQVGVPVDLPKTSAQQVGGKDEPLVVSVNSKDEVFLGETKYELAELSAKLQGGECREARSARLHPRRQGDQLRPHDGSHGRGDQLRLPPARPARRAGRRSGAGRARRRPGLRRRPQLRPPRRGGEAWPAAFPPASRCARRQCCRRPCISWRWWRRS